MSLLEQNCHDIATSSLVLYLYAYMLLDDEYQQLFVDELILIFAELKFKT